MMAKKDFSKQTVAANFFSEPMPPQNPPHLPDPQESIIYLPLDRLEPYPDQPFRSYSPDKLQELTDDIRENGILSPIIVRPYTGNYQILSGHNRAAAATEAGLSDAPCIVKIANDDEAMLILVNTNLNQRQGLLPSEKAKAYQMRMDAMKRQGKRTDLTLSPRETKLDTASSIAENESRANVFRYLRLNKLHPKLITLIDDDRIPFKAGVQLSYLSEERQLELTKVLETKRLKLDERRAEQLRVSLENRSEPLTEILDEISKPLKCSCPSQLTKKISLVVPTDPLIVEQLKDIRKQFLNGTSVYIVLSELIDKIAK